MPSLKELKANYITEYDTEPYLGVCEKCQTELTVYTQGNAEDSEYNTTVYVPCPKCGNLIRFELPVN
jgi:DNA-directed RNA polymerase subunit M/transcription elongation factor TFIIS